MNVVFLGATKGMGRALARLMAERGDALFLLGRDERGLQRSREDLRARAGSEVGIETAHCDLADPSTFGPALDAADQALPGFDTVVVTAGTYGTQDTLERDPERIRRLLDVNFTNTVLFCEEARKRLLARGRGTLCVFSSVAGDRGRSPVVLYGASKAGLSAYLEALDHRYRREGLRTVCVKPGFVKTGMTAALEPPPFAGKPEPVARRVLAGIDRGTPLLYAPWIWAWIMRVIRCLPRAVLRRVGF